jgi:multidrug efflux pump
VIPGGGAFAPVNTGLENIFLVDPDRRGRTQGQIFSQLSKGLESFTGVRTFPAQPPTIGSRFGGQPVQFVLQAPTLEQLVDVLPSSWKKPSSTRRCASWIPTSR